MPTLHRAVPLDQWDDLSIGQTQDLDLDVTGIRDAILQQNCR
jgi:hypothetical protein